MGWREDLKQAVKNMKPQKYEYFSISSEELEEARKQAMNLLRYCEQHRKVSLYLEELSKGKEVTSMDEMVIKLADNLGGDYLIDGITHKGLQQVIREAIANAKEKEFNSITTKENLKIPIPFLVTFYDDDEGWVRIPWYIATMEHLSFMIKFREKQIKELEESAQSLEELNRVLYKITELPKFSGKSASCSKILEEGIMRHYVKRV